MIGREYLMRQVMTLLRMAQVARDPKVSAALAVKAADLKLQLDESPPVPDASPRAENVDGPKTA